MSIIQVGQNKEVKTVKEALELADKIDKAQRIIIELEPGIYEEKLDIARPNITIRKKEGTEGEVKLTYGYGATMIVDGKAVGTANSCSLALLDTAENFIAQDITIENSYNISVVQSQTQAVALRVSADRSSFIRCRLLGRQDTLYIKDWGRCYFKDCYIEGTVDFIFGDAPAVLDHCEIVTAKRSGLDEDGSIHHKGYIAAPNHSKWQAYGYLFWNCSLYCDKDIDTSEEYNQSFLARNWNSNFVNVTLVNCYVGEHINPKGWVEWNKDTDTSTIRYFEYNTMKLDGSPYDMSKRVPWSKQLDDNTVKAYNPYHCLKGEDNWDPAGLEAKFSNVDLSSIDMPETSVPEEQRAAVLTKTYDNERLERDLYAIADRKECVYYREFRQDKGGILPKDVEEKSPHNHLKAIVQTNAKAENGKLLIYQEMGMGGKTEHDYCISFPKQQNKNVEVGFWMYAESLERVEIFTSVKSGEAIGMVLIDNNANVTAYGRKGRGSERKNLMPKQDSLNNWYYIQIIHHLKPFSEGGAAIDFKCYDVEKNLLSHYEGFAAYEGGEDYIEQFTIRPARGASKPIKLYIDTFYVKTL
jgi:pectinesterase